MKKSDLKQLIREELSKIINSGTSYEQYLSDIEMEVDEMDNQMYSPNGSEEEIENIIGHLSALQGEIYFKSSLTPSQKQLLDDIISKEIAKAESFIQTNGY
jgi:hypothetical protein